MGAEGTQTPLKSYVVLLLVLILDKVPILFVYRVVCEVHELIVLVYFLGVGFRGKASKAFLVDIDLQRLVRGD